ncbi:MAG TPA: acetyltransferase [Saprospiraceae bacterium]|nr:acetyltransferase [Saprospiraceae bacterium]
MRAGIVLIGYSGHAYVVADSMQDNNLQILGYCDKEQKKENPLELNYLGSEGGEKAHKILCNSYFFITIGDNSIREKVFQKLIKTPSYSTIQVAHHRNFISKHVELGMGIYIGSNTSINAFSEISNGVICNTGCIIEHECKIGAFAHIAPGAVLAGNVEIGERTFVGANSVIKQGVKIGKDVTIGAGSVVINDIPDNITVVGNPARIIKPKI